MNKINKKYEIIYADPPYHFKNYNDKTATKWVGQHYPIMSLQEIKDLNIQSISNDNCVLFLWTTFPMLSHALDIIKCWDFKYKTVAFVWVKVTKKNKPFIGMGYWTRSNAEIVLLATKGKTKRLSASVSQIIIAPRGKHSEKPDIVRKKIVELLGDLNKIELFATKKVSGWDCMGYEINGKDIRNI